MPKVCSKAAAGPALSRVFTPTNPTPRTLYSACAASSAGASTRHGGHAAYQTLTTNGAPRIATESNSSLPYVLPRISRGSARVSRGISTMTPSPETYPALASLAASEELLHAARRGVRTSRLPPSRSVARRLGPGLAPLRAAVAIECQDAGRESRRLRGAGDCPDTADHPLAESGWPRPPRTPLVPTRAR